MRQSVNPVQIDRRDVGFTQPTIGLIGDFEALNPIDLCLHSRIGILNRRTSQNRTCNIDIILKTETNLHLLEPIGPFTATDGYDFPSFIDGIFPASITDCNNLLVGNKTLLDGEFLRKDLQMIPTEFNLGALCGKD